MLSQQPEQIPIEPERPDSVGTSSPDSGTSSPDSGHASPDSGIMELAFLSGSSDNTLALSFQTSSDNSGYDSNAFLNGFSDSVASFNWSTAKEGASVYYNWYGDSSFSFTTLTDGTPINGHYIQFHNNTETEFTVGKIQVFAPLMDPITIQTTIMHEKLTWWVRMTTTPSLRLTPMKCGIWSPASPWSSRTVPRWDWVPRSQITMWN